MSRPHLITKLRRRLARLFTAPETIPAADDPFEGLPEMLRSNVEILAHGLGLAETQRTGAPTDAAGAPIPWYTYPAVEYLSQLGFEDLEIFEYGCGNSTLFYTERGARCQCVEHDPEWHARITAIDGLEDRIALREDRRGYAERILDFETRFDIVVVDGVWRNDCVAAGLERIASDGIVILDNSDWYTDASATLRERGYTQIDFSGFGPCNRYCWTTSLFLPVRSRILAGARPPRPIGGQTVEPGPMW